MSHTFICLLNLDTDGERIALDKDEDDASGGIKDINPCYRH